MDKKQAIKLLKQNEANINYLISILNKDSEHVKQKPLQEKKEYVREAFSKWMELESEKKMIIDYMESKGWEYDKDNKKS